MPAEVTYLTAFLAGLLGGVHCLGMCGGIVGALTFGIRQDHSGTKTNLFPYILAYNGGRLFSYTLAGALIGGISMLASHLPLLNNLQFALQIFAALFMIALGLYIGGWWFGLRKIEQAGGLIWRRIEPFSRRFIPVKSPLQALILGLLWGWLPCGLVYTILFSCISTGSALQGALLMLSFGLGTLPLLLAMGIFATSLSNFIRQNWISTLAGVIIIAFGIFSLFNLSLRIDS